MGIGGELIDSMDEEEFSEDPEDQTSCPHGFMDPYDCPDPLCLDNNLYPFL